MLSYVIGNCSDPEGLGRIIRDASSRPLSGGGEFFNEIVYAFSPDHGRVFVPRAMAAFRAAWGELAQIPPADAGLPRVDRGVYFLFECRTFRDTPVTRLINSDDTQAFAALHEFSLRGRDPGRYLPLMNALSRLATTKGPFPSVYRFMRPLRLRYCADRRLFDEDFLLFAPKPGVGAKACLVKLGPLTSRNEKLSAAKAWLLRLVAASDPFAAADEPAARLEELLERLRASSAADSVDRSRTWRDLMGRAVVLAWDFENRGFSEPDDGKGAHFQDSWSCEPFPQHALFGVFAGDRYERIPERLNKDQKEIAESMRRQRLVRGGPGTGKTLTLLHHAARLCERTGGTVLVVSKTHTLGFHNKRRLAATYLARYKNVPCFDEDWIRFMTIGTLMCELSRWTFADKYQNGCLRQACTRCMKKNEGCKDPSAVDCACRGPCCNDEIRDELLGLAETPPGEEKARLVDLLESACAKCRQETYELAWSGELPVPEPWEEAFATLQTPLAGVLVDEAQLFTEDELRILYEQTERTNPLREFYIFADEEQSMRTGSLQKDAKGKLVVRPPAAEGFGRWKTLRGNHRVRSRLLLGVYRKMQQLLSDRYDLEELGMELPERDEPALSAETSVAKVFRIDADACPADFDALLAHVGRCRRWMQSETLVVVADSESFVRKMSGAAASAGWATTHLERKLDEADERKEKKMRMGFLEQKGKVHLTTVDCAQGRTFDNVLFVLTRAGRRDGMEEVFTGMTRAASHLQVLDCTEDSWLYSLTVS